MRVCAFIARAVVVGAELLKLKGDGWIYRAPASAISYGFQALLDSRAQDLLLRADVIIIIFEVAPLVALKPEGLMPRSLTAGVRFMAAIISRDCLTISVHPAVKSARWIPAHPACRRRKQNYCRGISAGPAYGYQRTARRRACRRWPAYRSA